MIRKRGREDGTPCLVEARIRVFWVHIWTKMMFIGQIWLVWWCWRWMFAEEVPI